MDIVVVGAGAAGLAAAAVLRARGLDVLVLEASARIGGRARTSTPPVLGGAWLDEGAQWLHAPERNPLLDLARERGVPLADAFGGRDRVLWVDGRRATAADEHAYAAADARWRAAMAARVAAGPDTTLADAAGALRQTDPWCASVEHWEATIIAAADPERLGLADWAHNELPDGDLVPPAGFGTLLAQCLGGPVRLGETVRAIDTTAADDVRVETSGGTLRARAVLVTVSTGVLRAERIRFTPALPAPTLDAIGRLPMGLLSKIVLPATGAERFDVSSPLGGLIERRLARPGEPAIHFNLAFRDGVLPFVTGFVGGRTAWALADDPVGAADWARGELAALYGAARAGRGLGAGAFATDWGTDPHHLGAYAYAGPGDAGARAALQAPVAGGRLLFAGEATSAEGLAGTAGGAIREGRRAAAALERHLARGEKPV